jgi:hypothetical protein
MALTEEATVPNRTMLIRGVRERASGARLRLGGGANADKVNALVESSSRPRYIVGLATRATDPAVRGAGAAPMPSAPCRRSPAGARTRRSRRFRYRAALKASQRGSLVAWSNRQR